MTVSSLDNHLGYWLRMVSNAVSQTFARRLDAHDVTVAEWVFLRALFDAPALPPSRLAAQMSMTKGAISKLADRLCAKALVERQPDPADGRGHRLALTPAGRALVPALAAEADANDAAFFALLPDQDRQILTSLLKALATGHGLTASPTD